MCVCMQVSRSVRECIFVVHLFMVDFNTRKFKDSMSVQINYCINIMYLRFIQVKGV